MCIRDRLRVNTDQVVRLIPGRSCRDWSAPGAGVVNSRALALANNEDLNDKRIGMPPSDQPNNNSEVYVRPNEPLTIVYSGASAVSYTHLDVYKRQPSSTAARG